MPLLIQWYIKLIIFSDIIIEYRFILHSYFTEKVYEIAIKLYIKLISTAQLLEETEEFISNLININYKYLQKYLV